MPGQAVIDEANGLLAESPSLLATTVIAAPGGLRLLLTIRTPTTTLTVILPEDAARAWAGQIRGDADKMTGGMVASPAPGKNGRG